MASQKPTTHQPVLFRPSISFNKTWRPINDLLTLNSLMTIYVKITNRNCWKQCCGTGAGTAGTVSFWPKKNRIQKRILALGSGSGSGSGSDSCCTKNIKLNLLWQDTGWHMHEAGERKKTKIMATGRSLYRKNNLKFKGRNRNRNWNRGKKMGPGTGTGT